MSDMKSKGEVIQGFDDQDLSERIGKPWIQNSNRKIRMGIAGYGLCRFGFLQNPEGVLPSFPRMDHHRQVVSDR